MIAAQIRIAQLEDSAELSRVGRQSFSNAYRGTADDDEIDAHLDAYFAEAAIRREMQRPDVQYWIATAGDSSAGLVKLRSGDVPEQVAAASAVEVQQLYVASNFQRAGIGRQLMDCAVAEARRRGVEGLWLSVWTDADWATAFYRAYGYEVRGELPFLLGRTEFSDYLMWLALDYS